MTLLIVLIVVLDALLAIAWLLYRRRKRHRDPFRVRDASVSIAKLWAQRTFKARENDDDSTEQQDVALAENTLNAIRDDLINFEQRLLSSTQPLRDLRREIMDSVDRRMLNREILALPPEARAQLRLHSGDVIQTDDQARHYIAANELRLEMLREYAAQRFGDRAENDWFAVYEQACQLKSRSLRHFLQRSISGELQETENTRHQAISLVDEELKKRLLLVEPGKNIEAFNRA